MNLVTLLGFDITHVMLSITKLPTKPNRVIAIIAKFGEYMDPRVISAINSLKQVSGYMGISSDEIYINVLNYEEAVENIRKILLNNLPLVLDLGGGPRILVIESLIAYLSLPTNKRSMISIMIYLEGMNRVEVLGHDKISRMISPKVEHIELTYNEKIILNILKTYRELRLHEIKELLEKEAGIVMSKQNIVRILKKLMSKELVDKVGKGIYRAK